MESKQKQFQINNIYKKYNNLTVFKDTSIDFMKLKNIIGVVGPNGAGKSTIFKILSGLARANKGTIDCNLEIAKLIENPGFMWYRSGLYNLNFFLDTKELEFALTLVDKFKMEEYINRRCYSYSLGMKQKLALVIVLSKKSDIILLDEPTLSLDADSVNALIEIVKELSETKKIIFSTHDLQSLSHIFQDIIYVKNQRLDILEKKTFNSTSFIVRVRDYKLFEENFKSADFKKNSDNEFVVMIENNKIDLTIKEFTDYGLLKLVCLTNNYGVK